MTWPWTNLKKELERRSKDLELNQHEVKLYTVESIQDMIEDLRNYKPSFFERIRNYIKFTSYDVVWSVYRFFKPCHQRIRKAIPRQWCDLTELTLLINFEIIKSYVEEEMQDIEWETEKHHKEAAEWLRSSYKYITEDRDQLQQLLEQAYDNVDHKSSLPYSEKYKDVILAEKRIEEGDKAVLIGIANYRGFLWS